MPPFISVFSSILQQMQEIVIINDNIGMEWVNITHKAQKTTGFPWINKPTVCI